MDALSFSLEVQRQFLDAEWEPDLLKHHACSPQWTSLRAAFLKHNNRLWEGSFGVVDTDALDRTIDEAMQAEQLEGMEAQGGGGSETLPVVKAPSTAISNGDMSSGPICSMKSGEMSGADIRAAVTLDEKNDGLNAAQKAGWGGGFHASSPFSALPLIPAFMRGSRRSGDAGMGGGPGARDDSGHGYSSTLSMLDETRTVISSKRYAI